MQSETIGKLAEALAKAQGLIKHATKDGMNPHFKSPYATLASIWDAVRSALTTNGLSVMQTFDFADDESPIIITTLAHSSGEWVSGQLKLKPTQNTPQGIGSAITYGRRYSLAAIVGVAPDDDDDGNDASVLSRTPQPEKTAMAARSGMIVPEQIKAIKNLCTIKGIAIENIGAKFNGEATIDGFTFEQASEAIRYLQGA